MNTNGMSARPNAMAAPAAGAVGAIVGATATRPASSDQKAGASSDVAMVMARHLRCGASGLTPRLAIGAWCEQHRLSPSPSRR